MWALPLSALTAGLRNMGLGQFRAKELLLLENELQVMGNDSIGTFQKSIARQLSSSRFHRLSSQGHHLTAPISPFISPAPQAWHNASPMVSSGRDNALRAKASIDRCLRLAADYSDSIMMVQGVSGKDVIRVEGFSFSCQLCSFLLTCSACTVYPSPIRCTATQLRTWARVSGCLRTWPLYLEVRIAMRMFLFL